MDQDLLTDLESRWAATVELVAKLRSENTELTERLRAQEACCVESREQVEAVKKQMIDLQVEKEEIETRVDALLVKISELAKADSEE